MYDRRPFTADRMEKGKKENSINDRPPLLFV